MKKIEQQNYLLGIHPRRRHDEAAPAPQRRRKAGSGGGANAPSVARDEGNEWGGGVDCLSGGVRWKRGRPDESQLPSDSRRPTVPREPPSVVEGFPLSCRCCGRAAALCGSDLTGCLGWACACCLSCYGPTAQQEERTRICFVLNIFIT